MPDWLVRQRGDPAKYWWDCPKCSKRVRWVVGKGWVCAGCGPLWK